MRRVTANPPKTLMLASRIATNESTWMVVSSCAIWSMAPTTNRADLLRYAALTIFLVAGLEVEGA